MIDMVSWRDKCGRALYGFTNAASILTGPIQMDGTSNVSRQCAVRRLQNAREIARRCVRIIDFLLADLEAES